MPITWQLLDKLRSYGDDRDIVSVLKDLPVCWGSLTSKQIIRIQVDRWIIQAFEQRPGRSIWYYCNMVIQNEIGSWAKLCFWAGMWFSYCKLSHLFTVSCYLSDLPSVSSSAPEQRGVFAIPSLLLEDWVTFSWIITVSGQRVKTQWAEKAMF